MILLIAIEPRAYSGAIGRAIAVLRPHLEVRVVEPDELGREVERLNPEMVICSSSDAFPSDGRPAWVEFRPYEEPAARVCLGGRYSELREVDLDDLLGLVDEAEGLSLSTRALGDC